MWGCLYDLWENYFLKLIKSKKKAQNVKEHFIILTTLKLNISVEKSENTNSKSGGNYLQHV